MAGITMLAAGCGPGPDRSVQTRVFAQASPDAVFADGILVLRSEFQRLNIDRELRKAVSAPVEFRTASDTGTAPNPLRARDSLRRIATFSVSKRADGAVARLRIDIERKDTEHQQVRQYQGSRLSDTPSHTAIDRDAATTQTQNTVWTPIRRDRALERALLDELQERIAPPTQSGPGDRESSDRPASG
jgi:hypothetical protein